MFTLPGRLSSPALQRPGAFLHYVNDICTELCDVIQTNVTKVYEGLNSPSRQKPQPTTSCETPSKSKSEYLLKNAIFVFYISWIIASWIKIQCDILVTTFSLSLGEIVYTKPLCEPMQMRIHKIDKFWSMMQANRMTRKHIIIIIHMNDSGSCHFDWL